MSTFEVRSTVSHRSLMNKSKDALASLVMQLLEWMPREDGVKSASPGEVQIRGARTLAQVHDLQAVVIVAVERDGTVRVVTYGENPQKCDAIGDWGQGLWRHAISAVPFQTRFGWGNGGHPAPLTVAEFASLTQPAQDYARRHGGAPNAEAAS